MHRKFPHIIGRIDISLTERIRMFLLSSSEHIRTISDRLRAKRSIYKRLIHRLHVIVKGNVPVPDVFLPRKFSRKRFLRNFVVATHPVAYPDSDHAYSPLHNRKSVLNFFIHQGHFLPIIKNFSQKYKCYPNC